MSAHFVSKNLGRFCLPKILKGIDLTNEEILSKFQDPFPKNEERFLSRYHYKKRYIEIIPQGEIVGGLPRMFVSLVDLSFTRSLVADVYGRKGYRCYDPASMFCLEISRILDGYRDTKSFCKVLRDPQRGLHYTGPIPDLPKSIFLPRMTSPTSEQDVERKSIGKSS